MTTPPLLRGLVDDAGLFPPEQLPMAAAVDRHRVDRATAHPMHSLRFVCPANRLEELRGVLAPGERLRLSVILEAGAAEVPGRLPDTPGLELAAVEAAVPAGTLHRDGVPAWVRTLPPGTAVWLEPGWDDHTPAAVAALGGSGTGVKLRCGGVRAELFPGPAAVAAALTAAAAAMVPAKATAGLHRAVSYTDPSTGFDHLGFLNLLLAAGRAARGDAVADVAAVLTSRDAAALVEECRNVDAVAARSLLTSYGSCSTAEPVAEVTALGLL